MKEIIVIGGGGHAKVVISIIKKIDKFRLLGYVDIKNRGSILGIDYLGNDDDYLKKPATKNAVLGIGITVKNNNRYNIIEKFLNNDFNFPVIISPDAIVNEDVKINAGTVIIDGAIINSGSKIGAFSIINTGSSIDHDCLIGDHVHIAPGAFLNGGVKVGDRSFIASGSTIIQFHEIGKDCVIGAGAVVTKDCLSTGTYLGIPARKLDEK